MSGGSMNYLYNKLENDANFRQTTPERKAFALHLVKVAKALHDIEWVDSFDYGPGDENEAIRACIGDGPVLDAAIDQAHEAEKMLRAELERACSGTRLYPIMNKQEQTWSGNHGRKSQRPQTLTSWAQDVGNDFPESNSEPVSRVPHSRG